MLNRLLADLLVLLHLAYILFVVLGGILVRARPWVAWLHLPAAAWGAIVSAMGWVCPLTPWEQEFRRRAGQVGYTGGFIEHYLIPIIYPAGLTLDLQRAEAVFVVLVNLVLYRWAWRTWRARREG
jgi:hypothetical protein